jgi:hypothetical protein
MINLRDAKTIYVDVTRVVTVTYRHQAVSDPAVSSLITIFGNNKVICHAELAKTNFGFAFGPLPASISELDFPPLTSSTTYPTAHVAITNLILRKVKVVP